MCAKYYENPTTLSRVIAKNVGDVFFETHCITTYCGIWTEGLAGRGGNHIASALIAALKKAVDDTPGLKHVILWSDSCVPQNKNSIMSFALLDFLWNTTSLESIEQKFGEPGHTSIQEIDNIHSQIEKRLKLVEVYSPISLCRVLLTVNHLSLSTLFTEDL